MCIVTTELDYQIEEASKSKNNFISFLHQIEVTTVVPWVVEWLNDFWTDSMSNVFFSTYWNGSLDTVTLYTSDEELPSIVDDINKCLSEMI